MILKGYEVWVQLGPERLPEYSTSRSGTNEMICHIPAEDRKTFTVHWKDQTKGRHFTGPTMATVHIDGLEYDQGACTKSNRKNNSEGFRETSTTVRPYKFEGVRGTWVGGTLPHKDLGNIKVTVNKIEIKSYGGFPAQDSMPGSKLLSLDYVPDDIKLSVGLADVRNSKVARKKPNFIVKKGSDQEDDPYLVFTFKYRKPESLHAKGHITSNEMQKYKKQVEAYTQGMSKAEPQSDLEIEEYGDEIEAKVDHAMRLLKDVKTELAKRKNATDSGSNKRPRYGY